MKKRIAKKKGKVINSELWNLDITIAKFVLPRLKRFKADTIAYPGRDEMATFEDWQNGLDKMIKSFELVIDDGEIEDWREYDSGQMTLAEYKELRSRKWTEKQEGLDLFAKWYNDLWW